MVDENDGQRAGDVLKDAGRAGNDLQDPNALAHDLADGARALGAPDAADLIDDAVGLLDGVLPNVEYDIYWGKASALEQGADMAEGIVDDAIGGLGGLGGKIVKGVVDRGEKMLEQQLGGTTGAKKWMLYRFRLAEEFSRPWALHLTLVRPEVPPPQASLDPSGGLLTKAAGFVEGIKTGGTKALLKDAEDLLMDATGLSAPSDSSPADNDPQTGVPLDPANFLNQPISVSFSRWNHHADQTRRGVAPVVERWLTGVVSEFEDLGGSQMNVRLINLTVVPAMWKLSLRRNCRIFQDMNAIEIVREVFETASVYAGLSHGMIDFVDKLTDGVHLNVPAGPPKIDADKWTPKRSMTVQYNETDLDFVHRILESEGISYFFDCKKRSERVILFEDPNALSVLNTVDKEAVPVARPDEIRHAHPPPETNRWDDTHDNNENKGQPEVIWKLGAKQRLNPKKLMLRDYNPRLAQAFAARAEPPGGDTPMTPFTQDVSSESAPRPLRPYETDIPNIANLGGQYSYPFALTPPPDPDGPNPAYQPYAPAPNSVLDPAARLRDGFRTMDEVVNGEGNVSTLRPGVIVEVIGYIDYRTRIPAGFQAANFALQPPPPPPASATPQAATNTMLQNLQSWRSQNDSNDQLRAHRDDTFKARTRILVTRVEHFGACPDLDTLAHYDSPQGFATGQLQWQTGLSDLNGNPATRTTSPVGSPTIPATPFTPKIPGTPLPNSGAGPNWAQDTVDGINTAKQWAPGLVPGAGPTQLFYPSPPHVVARRAAFAGPNAQPSPLLDFVPPSTVKDSPAQTFYNRFEGIILDSNQPLLNVYRPLQLTEKPRIKGIQTALVVNQDSNYGDNLDHQLNVDYGHRVKVHFHWDRRSDSLIHKIQKHKSSCWVPVAQLQAGPSEPSRPDWGTSFIPRAGMEVVVAFIDGDPDRPMIIGCVPNGHKPPAVVPMPQPRVVREDPKGGNPIPVIADDPDPSKNPPTLNDPVHAYRSVIKSQSEPYSADTGNWIVFDDNDQQEWIQIRAQNQLIKDVTNDYLVNVGSEADQSDNDPHRQINAVKLDQHETFKKDVLLTVKRDRTKTVRKHEIIKILAGDLSQHVTDKDETITIDRMRAQTMHGFDMLTVGPHEVMEKDDDDKGQPNPRRSMTLYGSQLVTTKKRTDPSPDDPGDENIYVRKTKTDMIGGKLTVETKGGLSVALSDPDAQSKKNPTQISAGKAAMPPGDPGLLSVTSENEINLSSAGIVSIRSDNNDVLIEGDEMLWISTLKDAVRLTLKNKDNPEDDVVLAGGENSKGIQGIRITVGGDSEKKTTLLMDDNGILIKVDGTVESSIEVKKNAMITLKGEFLRLAAADTVSTAGAVTYRETQGN